MECYLLNTGSVGYGNGVIEKISIETSTGIMKHIASGGIRWTCDPDWGYEVPVAIPGLDIGHYNLRQYYSAEEYQGRVDKLRRERLRWLAKYKELGSEIVQTFL